MCMHVYSLEEQNKKLVFETILQCVNQVGVFTMDCVQVQDLLL